MLKVKDRPISIMVIYCCILHLEWAALLFIDPAAAGATPVSALHRFVGSIGFLQFTLILASALALTGLSVKSPWGVLYLIPQQCLLMISAVGALRAIYLGQFADGVLRPYAFIAADQLHIVLAALGHATAIIVHARTKV